ncbi:TPA: TfoX/Sxy family protein [Clostridium botulinum]|uniref:TfoX/Sxy family protein n=1 Tax=Clostridium botulinum TaxID=1491 RepID=UPI0029A995A2|nr:TfoX/Sxy family protein [Clostridium botulinum]HDK7178827.1 TfoX/Sxy family protein [Clostridium botulinum]HDK7190874.1 TfoX/Sxy family protein [Clostridium botulinum]HDK7214742.1 TfoX/Sxy family protein [Clostridium botulinum]HDK7224836.1 TfoX/Sxy family protein [Clostridium botulinum]
MASNIEFVEYICDQISGAGNITYKKMFGDYGVYCNKKIIGLICDNQFFLKITKAGRELLNEAIEAPAYEGAKPSFLIEFLDDREYLSKIVLATYKELPMPKPKKKRIKNSLN